MNELIKKVIAFNEEAVNSLENFIDTAKNLGYSQEEIDQALDQLDGFPLEDDDLDEITGGFMATLPHKNNFTKM